MGVGAQGGRERPAGPRDHEVARPGRPDFVPRTGSITAVGPGWVLVCSDGLWNYVSEASDLQRLVSELSPADGKPLPLADALVEWANGQGGKDNISVALARVGPPLS